ncbi:hypothetical protein C8J56DRAFT_1061867 [Mycena floridula]|nr:hypothetical protein C8J56DRAFT_1061867 [Mycena floridula]
MSIERCKSYGNHGPEEVTLFVTGLIESKRTAPFHNNNQALDPDRAFLQKQILTLSGFRSPLFEQSVERLRELITMFEGSYPEHAVETWDLPTTTIQASNRYFTRSSDTGSLGILDLDHDIDPYGILAAAGRDGKRTRWNRMIQQRHKDQGPGFRQIQLGKHRHQFPEEAYVQFYKDSEPEGIGMTSGNGSEEAENDEDEDEGQFRYAGKGMRRRSVG